MDRKSKCSLKLIKNCKTHFKKKNKYMILFMLGMKLADVVSRVSSIRVVFSHELVKKCP